MNSSDHSERPANAPQLFAFEQPSCEDFTYIPLSVRFHLDRGGWRLSLVQWQAFPYSDRVALAAYPVRETRPDPHASSPDFDTFLGELAARDLSDAVERMPPLQPMPGEAASDVPETVQAQCAFAGVAPLSPSQWSNLSLFQRYALAKLARKPKPNHDFAPALREFGLSS